MLLLHLRQFGNLLYCLTLLILIAIVLPPRDYAPKDHHSGHTAIGSSFTSGGIKGWEGSLIGNGVGTLIGLVGGAVFSIFTDGLSVEAALAAESIIGAASGSGGQVAQDAAEHKPVDGLQLEVAAAGGALMSAIGFGIGEYTADVNKSPAERFYSMLKEYGVRRNDRVAVLWGDSVFDNFTFDFKGTNLGGNGEKWKNFVMATAFHFDIDIPSVLGNSIAIGYIPVSFYSDHDPLETAMDIIKAEGNYDHLFVVDEYSMRYKQERGDTFGGDRMSVNTLAEAKGFTFIDSRYLPGGERLPFTPKFIRRLRHSPIRAFI